MTILTAYDLGPVYLCSPISCWFGAYHYIPVTWKHSQVLNSPSCVQSMHVLSVLCSSGLEIPGSPSELSGQHFLLRMLSWSRNDRSSCPLPWPIWFRCSFLRVPGARCQSTLETIWQFCLLICHANQTIIFLRAGGNVYLSLHSHWLEKYSTFRTCSMNVFEKKWIN